MIKETTIHPHSTFYLVWEAVVMVTVLVIVFLHPYTACFSVEAFDGKTFLSEHKYNQRGVAPAQPVIVVDGL